MINLFTLSFHQKHHRRIHANPAHAEPTACVALLANVPSALACKATVAHHQPVVQNVWSALNVHIISPALIRSVAIHAQAHAATTLNAMSTITIQFVVVAMALSAIHSKVVHPNVSRLHSLLLI